MPGKRKRPRWARSKDIKVPHARRYIDNIASTLKREEFVQAVGIQVTEVFVGGSIGQGTTVPGHYDADLVLYSRDLDHKDAAANGYKIFKERIDAYLKAELGDSYQKKGDTRVAIEFMYKSDKMILKVDLLLSPFWSTQDHFFKDLTEVKEKKRLMFSVSASKNQTNFIKRLNRRLKISQHQCSKITELIRRAKAWRNRTWTDGAEEGKPKSYLIALLVITAHGRVHYKGMVFSDLAIRVGEAMKDILLEITSDDQLDLVIPGTNPTIRETYSRLLPACPRIVDPANPSNNLYLSGVGPVPYGEEGEGKDGAKWIPFMEKITSIDLTIEAAHC